MTDTTPPVPLGTSEETEIAPLTEPVLLDLFLERIRYSSTEIQRECVDEVVSYLEDKTTRGDFRRWLQDIALVERHQIEPLIERLFTLKRTPETRTEIMAQFKNLLLFS